MKVKLQCRVEDYVTGRKHNIYLREDGKFWVLAVPMNPWEATDENVCEFVRDTYQEALAVSQRAEPGSPVTTN